MSVATTAPTNDKMPTSVPNSAPTTKLPPIRRSGAIAANDESRTTATPMRMIARKPPASTTDRTMAPRKRVMRLFRSDWANSTGWNPRQV